LTSSSFGKQYSQEAALGFIDVHTHITYEAYTSLLTEHGSHIYNLRPDSQGSTVVMRGNIRFMTFTEPMFDPEMRFAPMDEVGVDMQLLSCTCPNTYWAGPDIVEHLTRTMNDHLASVCNQVARQVSRPRQRAAPERRACHQRDGAGR
jgi:hypothetical protein